MSVGDVVGTGVLVGEFVGEGALVGVFVAVGLGAELEHATGEAPPAVNVQIPDIDSFPDASVDFTLYS